MVPRSLAHTRTHRDAMGRVMAGGGGFGFEAKAKGKQEGKKAQKGRGERETRREVGKQSGEKGAPPGMAVLVRAVCGVLRCTWWWRVGCPSVAKSHSRTASQTGRSGGVAPFIYRASPVHLRMGRPRVCGEGGTGGGVRPTCAIA